MITREVREWSDKVQRGEYSYSDAMEELSRFGRYLTFEELKLLKRKLETSYKK